MDHIITERLQEQAIVYGYNVGYNHKIWYRV
jgi:hypothetical protein